VEVVIVDVDETSAGPDLSDVITTSPIKNVITTPMTDFFTCNSSSLLSADQCGHVNETK
jgi:hypothetical protein